MTRLPDDQIDPYESRLTRRVDAFAEQAVRPIDAAAIAAAARAGARQQTLSGRLFGSGGSTARLGVILAGVALITALGVALGGGGQIPGPSPTPGTASFGVTVAPDCAAKNVSAEIVAWEGAAGHRIATVRLLGIDARCKLASQLRPALLDGGGHALIVGAPLPAPREWTVLGPGDRAETLVDMSNYCGAAPSGSLFLRLYLSDSVAIEARPATSIANPIDPPPCNGPTAPATIEIQPLGPVAP
jgi:hypothetical protein